MNALLGDQAGWWALAIIVLLPTLIIVAGEYQERLRQRGSPLAQPVATLRNVALPLFALWAVLVLVVNVDPDNVGVRLLATGVVLAVTVAVLQIGRHVAAYLSERGKQPGRRAVPQLALMLPRLLVVTLAAFVVFGAVWNVDLTGLFAALGVTTLIISVALQDTLSGLASGFLLLGDRPFGPGDWIKADDVEGRVVDVNWRSSRIKNRSGDLVVVPNATLSSATITNYSEPTALHRVVVSLQVAYSNAPTSAIEMLLAAAHATEGVLSDPPPKIRVVQVDDPLMGYDAHLWIDDYTIAPRVASDFGALVWYQSHRMDVPLPSPAFDLYHHDPIQEAADAEIGPAMRADRLRLSPLLADLSDEDMAVLAEEGTDLVFRSGETILSPEGKNRDLLMLWRGTARMEVDAVRGRSVELAAGDVFGLLNRFRTLPSAPRVVAITDCEALLVGEDAASEVASRNPELGAALNQLVDSRRRRFEPSSRKEAVASADLAAGEETGS